MEKDMSLASRGICISNTIDKTCQCPWFRRHADKTIISQQNVKSQYLANHINEIRKHLSPMSYMLNTKKICNNICALKQNKIRNTCIHHQPRILKERKYVLLKKKATSLNSARIISIIHKVKYHLLSLYIVQNLVIKQLEKDLLNNQINI